MRRQRIVIAGAGIGGLTAAIALARAGHEVEVLEQAPSLGATVGAGVTLAPNAMRVYARLGLEEALHALGVEPNRQRVQHWRDGRTLLTLDRGQAVRALYGAPYLYIHRGDLHAVLIRALEQTGCSKVRLGATVIGAVASGTGAAAELQGGGAVEGDLVIAADGVRSTVRQLFDPAEPHFTGHVAWRALAPISSPILHDLAAFPGVHVGPERMVVRYPVSGGRLLNLVFFARQEAWAPQGWSIPGFRSELAALFDGWTPEVAAMIDATDEARLFRWGVFAHAPLTTWVYRDRIALLGDAAHAMTPFLGQGASSAIEDALVLGRCVDESSSATEALGRYERARMDRCAFIQAESNANADRMQGDETHLFGMTEVRNEETLGLFTYDAGSAPI